LDSKVFQVVPKKEGESDSYRKRREAFKARHAGNISKGK
jgi:hypothetical protein